MPRATPDRAGGDPAGAPARIVRTPGDGAPARPVDTTSARDLQRLAAFLRGRAPQPEAALLRKHALAAHAHRSHRPPAAPAPAGGRSATGGEPGSAAAEFKRDHLLATLRHRHVRRVLRELLRAWNRAGIEPLLFKGFYLAEFVYPDVACRGYADVDALVAEAELARARRVAREAGWRETWARERSRTPFKHEDAVLCKDGVVLELHRLLLHCLQRDDRRQREISEAVMARSDRLLLDDAALRAPQPADSLVLLAIARSWSGEDHWRLRAIDYLDMRHLVARFDLDRATVEARARALGCGRTLALLLERCDPWRERLELRPPSRWQRHRWNLLVTPEHGNLTLQRLTLRGARGVRATLDVASQLPTLLRVRWSADRAPLPPAASDRRPRTDELERVTRGIGFGSRLLWRRADPCLPHAVALQRALAARGVDARLRVVRHDGRAHACVTVDDPRLGGPLTLGRCHALPPDEATPEDATPDEALPGTR